MARWGTMTERKTFTMTKEHRKRLEGIAYDTNISESKHVRNALDLYFEQLDAENQTEQSTMESVSDV